MAKKPNNKDMFKSTNKAIDQMMDVGEKELAKEYVATLTSIKKTLAGAYEKYGVDGILTREEMVKYGRLTKLEQHLVEEIHSLTNTQVRITKDSIRNVFAESYYRYGHMIETQTEMKIYKLLKPEIIDQMLFNELDLVKWDERVSQNNRTLVNQLREELMLGLVSGVGYDKTARAITKRMNIGLNKATKIVRTESRRAQESANLLTMQDAKAKGIVEKKRWVSTLDSRTRDTHGGLDGQVVDIDKPFKTRSGREAMAPHQFGVASEDINCRCTMITVVTIGDEVLGQKVRRNGEELIPYQTYDDWKQNL